VDYSDVALRDGGGRVTLRIFECLKPVIGAINGPAVGIGATMLLPMDVRIAAQEARFGFVFARRGIVMEAALVSAPYRRAGAGAGMVFFRPRFRCG
jgi:enoyl-CoA hydratase/carnithine racemase